MDDIQPLTIADGRADKLVSGIKIGFYDHNIVPPGEVIAG